MHKRDESFYSKLTMPYKPKLTKINELKDRMNRTKQNENLFLWPTHENLNKNGTENINNKKFTIWHIWLLRHTSRPKKSQKSHLTTR